MSITKENKKKIIGIRQGEKIHEELISVYEGFSTVEFKNYYVILPTNDPKKIDQYCKKFKAKKVEKGFSYTSENNKKFLSVSEIKKIITKEFKNNS